MRTVKVYNIGILRFGMIGKVHAYGYLWTQRGPCFRPMRKGHCITPEPKNGPDPGLCNSPREKMEALQTGLPDAKIN
jgi:hypothetical protein